MPAERCSSRPSLDGTPAAERLIVALDFDSERQALGLVDALGDTVRFYKIGYQLFLGAGMEFVRRLSAAGKRVFLDLKINDISATVESALAVLPADVDFVTVNGAAPVVRAARSGRRGAKPLLLAVPWLSSQDRGDLRDALMWAELDEEGYVQYVSRLAGQALAAGSDGLIASGDFVGRLRREHGDGFPIVAPGIRPEGTEAAEHKNVLTPLQAIEQGADYLVIGRPIRKAPDAAAAARAVIAEIEQGLERTGRNTG